jgi:hypothetical protein
VTPLGTMSHVDGCFWAARGHRRWLADIPSHSDWVQRSPSIVILTWWAPAPGRHCRSIQTGPGTITSIHYSDTHTHHWKRAHTNARTRTHTHAHANVHTHHSHRVRLSTRGATSSHHSYVHAHPWANRCYSIDSFYFQLDGRPLWAFSAVIGNLRVGRFCPTARL